jgi:hypothetical protein
MPTDHGNEWAAWCEAHKPAVPGGWPLWLTGPMEEGQKSPPIKCLCCGNQADWLVVLEARNGH